jgi:hypothetical protein
MSDSAHPGTPLVGKLHMLLAISAEPYSSALVGTSFGRLDCLEEERKKKVSHKKLDILYKSEASPELTDCSRYSIAWSWLV